MIPLWAILALTAAWGATAIPLLQERYRADGYALAFLNKVVEACLLLPIIVYLGIPHDPLFYVYTVLTALLYSVCDVLYFRAVPVIGSGLMTRLLPSSVLVTFVLWFAIKPDDIQLYLGNPVKAVGTGLVFALFSASTFFIKRCHVSWAGVRMIWPILVIASVGPLLSKLALDHAVAGRVAAGDLRAPANYLFFQALMMLICLIGYHRIKPATTRPILLTKNNICTALMIGSVMTLVLILRMKALELVDNPGFVSLIFFTDALWVIAIYKLRGRREDSNIWAGLGIVLSAALLVVVKSVL